jgi:hypothetical protein
VKTYTLDTSAINEVENSIAPLMRHAITFPVLEDGHETGVIIYVCASPFNSTPPADLVKAVAHRLTIITIG